MSTFTTAMLGALVTLALLASLQFIRYWRLTRDGFFVWFAIAFATFAVDWGLQLVNAARGEDTTGLSYLVRLCGFVAIAIAILVKNRKPP